MLVLLKRSLKDKAARNRRASDGGPKKRRWESAKIERLGSISMQDCESKGVDKGVPNARELVMNSPKEGSRKDGQEDTVVESRGDCSLSR